MRYWDWIDFVIVAFYGFAGIASGIAFFNGHNLLTVAITGFAVAGFPRCKRWSTGVGVPIRRPQFSFEGRSMKVRPPWIAMIAATAIASQLLAAAFMIGVCSYLNGGCQFNGAVIASMF